MNLDKDRIAMSNLTSKDIVVVIPTYKKELEEWEIISLKQAFSILSKYRIVFVCPEGLDISYESISKYEYGVERFDKHYFEGIEGYSELCTSTEFYSRFKEYEFLLIYQLDAFVFSDRLLEFADKGYDYWGAPVPSCIWKAITQSVGNGGFSLRNIQKHLAVLEHAEYIRKYIETKENENNKYALLRYEDQFIIYGARICGIDMKYPSRDEAFSFAVEFNINYIYDELKRLNVFGCHRWHKYKFDKWWSLITQYGYTLSDDAKELLKEKDEAENFNSHVLREIKNNCPDIIRKKVMNKKISVWGLGKKGQKYVEELILLGFKIENKYDKNGFYEYPSKEALLRENNPIVILSDKYALDMCKELDTYGLKRYIDYYTYADIDRYLIELMNIENTGMLDDYQ